MSKSLMALTLCVFVTSMMVGSTAEARDPSLVGWWKCDEGEGTTARDSSGYGNHGTFSGDPAWVAGHFGRALEFDGSDDCLVCGNDPSLDLTTWTIAFWLNAAENKNYNGFVIKGADAAENYEVLGFADGSFHFPIMTDNGTRTYVNTATGLIVVGEWAHFAYTYASTEGRRFYKDSTLVFQDTATGTPRASAEPLIIANERPLSRYTHGTMDDIRIYNRVLTLEELSSVALGKGPDTEKADKPNPANEAVDVPRDTTLGWEAGEFAAAHDVYFGTSFEDVNEASRDDPRGVLAGQGQADTTFSPAGLEYGRTYYWRIDEVNSAPDNTVYKGETWSFTAEPLAYPIAGLTATASASQVGMGPENTVNGSGLSDLDEHSTEPTQMWMASAMPAWIQFEFNQVEKLHELWVWNSNQVVESFVGLGAKDVTIEYSTDGKTWAALEDVPQFSRASGTAAYTANTMVDLGGVMAKFVKLTIGANWGGMAQQTGLSEVRFFYVPTRAFYPRPADDATGVSVETDLDWRPGREATSHVVSLGTDSNSVANGAIPGTNVTGHGYTPADLLLATEYFWKVDAVGNSGTYAGDVWSFATEEFAVVDDFEAYTDNIDAEATIWHAWVDGMTDDRSGSQVGYDAAPFAEKSIVRSGAQSMPLKYDNSSFAFSEATRTFDAPRNWTTRGIKTLSVHFAGAPGNGGQLYLKINSAKVLYSGAAADLTRGAWHAWNIDLSTVGNVINVRSLTIGVEGAGAGGTLYFDDIRLYPKTPEYVTPVDPGTTNLVALYALDGNAKDTSGKGNNGAVNGVETWVNGVTGQALQFDGASTYVDCGSGASLNLTDAVTVTAWIYLDFTGGDRKIAGNQDGVTGGYKMGLYTNNKFEFEIRTAANAATSNRNAAGGVALQSGAWYHVAGVYSKGQFIRTYVFGSLDRETITTAALGGSTGTFKLGREPMSASYFWLGSLDDVRVYNRVLSPEEILWVMGQKEPVAKPF